MRNIRIIIEYDGTNYHGWQVQANANTVQAVIENSIEKLTGERCNLIGSGRTDRGVHALGQSANFFTRSTIPGDRFSYALNGILPSDITIKESSEMEKNFNARYSAKGKRYKYLIYNAPVTSPILRYRALHIPYKLDIEAMKKAAECFLGSHDFRGFRAAGGAIGNSIRTITEISVRDVNGGVLMGGRDKPDERLIEFEIAGNGFLYNMVRIIVGTLVDVGAHRIPAENMAELIKQGKREAAGKTVAAHGLYLAEVYY